MPGFQIESADTWDRKIADDVSTAPKEKNVIIDCFAGAGGNAIAFALSGRWNQIFAVEKDEKTLACAKHNAEVYGVSKKIFWIHGDIFEVLQKRLKAALKKAVVFGSPPWGGESTPTLQLCFKDHSADKIQVPHTPTTRSLTWT